MEIAGSGSPGSPTAWSITTSSASRRSANIVWSSSPRYQDAGSSTSTRSWNIHEEDAAPLLGGTALTRRCNAVPRPASTGLHGRGAEVRATRCSAIRAAIWNLPVRSISAWSRPGLPARLLPTHRDLDADSIWDTGFSTEAALRTARFWTAARRPVHIPQAERPRFRSPTNAIQIDVLAPEVLERQLEARIGLSLDFPRRPTSIGSMTISTASASRRTPVRGRQRVRFRRAKDSIRSRPGPDLPPACARRLYVLLKLAHAANNPAGAIAIVSMDTFGALLDHRHQEVRRAFPQPEDDDRLPRRSDSVLRRRHPGTVPHGRNDPRAPDSSTTRSEELFLVLTIRRDHVTTMDPVSRGRHGYDGRGGAEMASHWSERRPAGAR